MERMIIIPAFEPEETCLRELVRRNWELGNQMVLVDDGSGKAYETLFWELGEQCIVLHHNENKGKGEAIKTALRYIKDELWECREIGIMDADGQHLPEDMERILTKAEANPRTLILGTRTMDSSVPLKSRLGNWLTAKIFGMLTGVYVSDTQTGLRAFSVELLDFMLQVPGSRYEYEMNMLSACAKQKIPILEIPIHTIYHDRKNSCSHFRGFRDSFRIYKELLRFFLSSFSSFVLDYLLFNLFLVLFGTAPLGMLISNTAARRQA